MGNPRVISGGFLIEFDEERTGTKGRIFHGGELADRLNEHLKLAAADFLDDNTSPNVRVNFVEVYGRFSVRVGEESIQTYTAPKKRVVKKAAPRKKFPKKTAAQILKSVPMNKMDPTG